jgi:hypothetical protein
METYYEVRTVTGVLYKGNTYENPLPHTLLNNINRVEFYL